MHQEKRFHPDSIRSMQDAERARTFNAAAINQGPTVMKESPPHQNFAGSAPITPAENLIVHWIAEHMNRGTMTLQEVVQGLRNHVENNTHSIQSELSIYRERAEQTMAEQADWIRDFRQKLEERCMERDMYRDDAQREAKGRESDEAVIKTLQQDNRKLELDRDMWKKHAERLERLAETRYKEVSEAWEQNQRLYTQADALKKQLASLTRLGTQNVVAVADPEMAKMLDDFIRIVTNYADYVGKKFYGEK